MLLSGASLTAIPTSVRASPVSPDKTPVAQSLETAASFGHRHWLGPDWWANRLQDWRRNGEWIECLRGERTMEARTAALLTHDLAASGNAVLQLTLAADTALGEGGFGGWLVGVGNGRLDPLSAALAQRGSGAGGGIFAVVDSQGIPAFREHTDDQHPVAFRPLPASLARGEASASLTSEPVSLHLSINDTGGSCRMTLVTTTMQGKHIGTAVLDDIPATRLTGGVLLVSSPPGNAKGARFRFRDIALGGERLPAHPDRALGPCLAVLHSLAGDVLKLAAHFTVMGEDDSKQAHLEIAASDGTSWRRVASAEIGDGSSAIFRLTGWDSSKPARFRIVYRLAGGDSPVFEGAVRADPVHRKKDLSISLQGCVLSVQHDLESNIVHRALPQEQDFGRYQPENFNFPHRALVTHSAAHDPDLIFVGGDQYYEGNPTRNEARSPHAKLDTLYRWHQWLVSYRDLVRDRPCVVLVDDHDVLQGNLWGDGGRRALDHKEQAGGYTRKMDVVRMIYRMQCGHNPDAYDPTPVRNGIPVSYTAFLYGGVSIALIEDRKWKSGPLEAKHLPLDELQLLGARQEAFLARWRTMHEGAPKVVLSETSWVSLKTDPQGRPKLDHDSDGWPQPARNRAVRLVRECGAVMLANDQHLASLVKMGVEGQNDGPLQFTGPAGGSLWERWFEPATDLPNARPGLPYRTGDWTDAFGHRMSVLAVANPRITFTEFRKHYHRKDQYIRDRSLKSEGYGVLRVERDKREFVFECWPWHVDPIADPDGQFAGWPYRLPFGEVSSDLSRT